MKPVKIIIRQEAPAFSWLLGSPEIIFATLQSQQPLSCLASPPHPRHLAVITTHEAGRITGQLLLFTHPFAWLPRLTWHPRQSLQKEHESLWFGATFLCMWVRWRNETKKKIKNTDRCLCHMFSAVSCSSSKHTVALAHLAERGTVSCNFGPRPLRVLWD